MLKLISILTLIKRNVLIPLIPEFPINLQEIDLYNLLTVTMMCLAKLVDLFPSLRDKQESLEFLPWLVVVQIVILLYVRSWVVDLKHGSRRLLGVTSVMCSSLPKC